MLRNLFFAVLSSFAVTSAAYAQYQPVAFSDLPGKNLKDCQFRITFINDVEYEDFHSINENSRVSRDVNGDGIASLNTVGFLMNALEYAELVQAIRLADAWECSPAQADLYMREYDRKKAEARAKGDDSVPGFMELWISEDITRRPVVLLRSGYTWGLQCAVRTSFFTLEKECPNAERAQINTQLSQLNTRISNGLNAQQQLTLAVYNRLMQMISAISGSKK